MNIIRLYAVGSNVDAALAAIAAGKEASSENRHIYPHPHPRLVEYVKGLSERLTANLRSVSDNVFNLDNLEAPGINTRINEGYSLVGQLGALFEWYTWYLHEDAQEANGHLSSPEKTVRNYFINDAFKQEHVRIMTALNDALDNAIKAKKTAVVAQIGNLIAETSMTIAHLVADAETSRRSPIEPFIDNDLPRYVSPSDTAYGGFNQRYYVPPTVSLPARAPKAKRSNR